MDRTFSRSLACAAVAGAVGLAWGSSAQAAVIASQDFNGGATTFGYAYSSTPSGGPAMTTTNGVNATAGVGGSGAAYYSVDSTNVQLAQGQTYWYWGAGLGTFVDFDQQPIGTGQSSYTFSGQPRGEGITATDGSATAYWRLEFQVADDVLPDGSADPNPDADGNGERLVDLRSPNFDLTGSFSSYTSDLSTWTVNGASGGSWANIVTAIDSGTDITGVVVFLISEDGGSWGRDATNVLYMDNVALDGAVPEPAGLALLGLGGLALLRRRRR